MDNQPLISVIMIFYNSEKFIHEAIESVISQTYENWELILVDDGSSDNSTEIAFKYLEKYPGKVRYFEHTDHQNRGMSASRNLGVKMSEGDFAAFLDADDVYLSQKLEDNIKIINTHAQADFMYSSTLYWYSWTRKSQDKDKDYKWEHFGVPTGEIIEPPTLLKNLITDRKTAPCICSFLIKKKTIENIGGFEEEFRGLFEDQVFLVKLFLNAKGMVSSGCWDKYRQHDKSSTNIAISEGTKTISHFRFWNWVEDFLLENNVKDFELWKIIRKRKKKFDRYALQYVEIESKAKKDIKKIDEYKNKVKQLRQKNDFLQNEIDRWKRIVQHHDYTKQSKRTQGKANTFFNKIFNMGINAYDSLTESTKPFQTEKKSGYFFSDTPFSRSRSISPLSKKWGWERGLPIDRYYIEKFLKMNSDFIRGKVLEISDNKYTIKFGGNRVEQSEILDIDEANPSATIVADITDAKNVPSESFDCIIFTQTLQLVYDYESAVKNLYQGLKKNGVLLVTFPGISKILVNKKYGWYWSFTSFSAEKIFSRYFQRENLEIKNYGNVLSACAFLYGLAAEEMSRDEMELTDPEFELLITVKATK